MSAMPVPQTDRLKGEVVKVYGYKEFGHIVSSTGKGYRFSFHSLPSDVKVWPGQKVTFEVAVLAEGRPPEAIKVVLA